MQSVVSFVKNKFFLKIKIADILLVLIIIGVGIFFCFSNSKSMFANKILVKASDKQYEFSLKQNKVYEVEGKIGNTKIEVIEGKVRVIESCCANKTCINQGFGQTIVCLPNEVIINVINEDGENEFDAVAQ